MLTSKGQREALVSSWCACWDIQSAITTHISTEGETARQPGGAEEEREGLRRNGRKDRRAMAEGPCACSHARKFKRTQGRDLEGEEPAAPHRAFQVLRSLLFLAFVRVLRRFGAVAGGGWRFSPTFLRAKHARKFGVCIRPNSCTHKCARHGPNGVTTFALSSTAIAAGVAKSVQQCEPHTGKRGRDCATERKRRRCSAGTAHRRRVDGERMRRTEPASRLGRQDPSSASCGQTALSSASCCGDNGADASGWRTGSKGTGSGLLYKNDVPCLEGQIQRADLKSGVRRAGALRCHAGASGDGGRGDRAQSPVALFRSRRVKVDTDARGVVPWLAVVLRGVPANGGHSIGHGAAVKKSARRLSGAARIEKLTEWGAATIEEARAPFHAQSASTRADSHACARVCYQRARAPRHAHALLEHGRVQVQQVKARNLAPL
eukprot:6183388-Pleurochrysis_carterae.AAC.3